MVDAGAGPSVCRGFKRGLKEAGVRIGATELEGSEDDESSAIDS